VTNAAELGTRSDARLTGLALTISARGGFCAAPFDGDRVLARLEGIAADVDDARQLAELAEGVAVVTDDHERAVDLLRHAGATSPLIWDVLELAAILVPACPRDSLVRASTFFGIVADRPTEQLLMLFELLVATVDQVESQTLLHVTRLAAGLDWPLRSFFRQVQSRRALSQLETGALASGAPIGAWITQGAPGRRRRSDPSDTETRPVRPLDRQEIARRLAPDAEIARALPGFERRQEQIVMAELVADALNAGGQLVLEAGTGTGKSLAYLLPSALHAVRNDQRVVVSTATTNLQDQLFEHDLPLVQTGLRDEPPLRACVLKGRNNSLCLRRWQLLLQAGDLSPADRMLLIKTLFWLPRTATGDRAELQLSQAEE
jgi:DNA polymerase-3 subunit epsilon/ATP-dependent DNA helicase DinG